jgi:hypothetical protein
MRQRVDELIDGTPYRACQNCLETKPLSLFGIDRSKKTGYKSICLACIRVRSNSTLGPSDPRIETYTGLTKAELYARWKQKNPERRKEISKKSRDKPENKQKRAQHMKAYRLKNPDAYKNWVQNNPDKANANWNRRRKYLKEAGIFAISKKEMARLYQSSCFYCGEKQDIQADHILPVSRGGTHSVGNLIPACKLCNMSKGNKTNMEWQIWKAASER